MRTKMQQKRQLVIAFAILIITIGQCVDIYLPSMPSMVHALHTNTTIIQLSITIALIAYGVGAPFYGPISDYFGRRITALIGISLFTMGSICCMLAPNIYLLLIGRSLQGVGFASASGVAAPAISDRFSGDELVKAYSYVGIALVIMPIVAPVLGGYLQHLFNWRAPFAFLFIYATVMLILFSRYFAETKTELRQGSIHPIAILKNYSVIVCNISYLGYIASMIFAFAGEMSYVVSEPFLFQTQLGLSAVMNGWLIFITALGFVIGSFASKTLCHRYKIITLLWSSGVLAVIGALIMFILGLLFKMSALTIVIPMVIFFIGAGLLYPSAIAGAMRCFPKQTGSAASIGGMLQVGVGGIFTSLIVHLHITHQLPLAIVLLVFSGLSLSAIFLAGRGRNQSTEQ